LFIFLDGLAKLLELHNIKSKIFADDVKVYLSIENDNCTVVLQNTLDLMSAYTQEWQLYISVSKCNISNIARKAPNVSYHIDGCVLPVVMSCRDLGVLQASDSSSLLHINEITGKGHQHANAILRCFETRDKDLLVRTFITYVSSLVEYNSVV